MAGHREDNKGIQHRYTPTCALRNHSHSQHSNQLPAPNLRIQLHTSRHQRDMKNADCELHTMSPSVANSQHSATLA